MTSQAAFILDVTTLSISVFACLIALIVLVVIVCHISYHRIQQEDTVTIIQCVHIYICILLFTTVLISYKIQTLLGDLQQQNFDTLVCIISGYVFIALLAMLYWAFINQAFYRLCRIVYANHRWLQFFRLYIIIPAIEFLLIGILLCPSILSHDVIYLGNEHYCFVSLSNVRGMIWAFFIAYGIPAILLLLIYIRIIIYLRRQSNNQTVIIKQQQQRDLLVIRRMSTIAGLLLAIGIPATVLLLILYITDKELPFTFCIHWFSMSLSMIILTPQLKSIVLNRIQRNQIEPNEDNYANTIPQR